MDLLDAAVALRLERLRRTPFARPGEGAAARFREQLELLIDGASHLDAGFDGEGLRWLVVLTPHRDPWCGTPYTELTLDARPGMGPEILHHLAALGDLPDDTWAFAHHEHLPWVRHLGTVGLHPSSVELVGEPHTALASLGHEPAEAAFEAVGLRVVPFQPHHLLDVMRLKARWFRAHPEFGWFIGHPAFLARDAAGLRADAEGAWVVLWDERVVGILRAGVKPSPHWGRQAGMDLVLAPELQGRGLATPAYRLLLREAAASGAQTLKGGTSQPAVLALARRMGRRPFRWALRRTPGFGWDHFLRPLDGTPTTAPSRTSTTPHRELR